MVSLLAHATMLGQDITIDLVRNVIGNTVKVTPRQLTFEYIAETVADHYNMPIDLLYGKSRKREISDARQLVMYLACIQIEQRMSIEKDFSREVQAITASLTQ